MRFRKTAAVIMLICTVMCLFGCGKKEASEKVKCVLGNDPEKIIFQELEFDDANRNITATINEHKSIIFHCDRKAEYEIFSKSPDNLKVYRLSVTLKNKSGRNLKNVKPYLYRQWDMLVSTGFSPAVTVIERKSKKIKTDIYALTDYDISVMRSAYIDNSFVLKYDIIEKGGSQDSAETYFTYK